jgi:ornithine cyclodeaminase
MLGHIGEVDIPIDRGVISRDHIRGDLYDLVGARVAGRELDKEVTVFKNGGGAHLDLMIARYLSDPVYGTD